MTQVPLFNQLYACANWNDEAVIRAYERGDEKAMGRHSFQAKYLRRQAWILQHGGKMK